MVVYNFSNPKYAPLENQLYIRQAMQYLIDQPAYIKSIQLGYGTPTYGPVPAFPQTSFLDPAEKSNPYPYDPATASSGSCLLGSRNFPRCATSSIDSRPSNSVTPSTPGRRGPPRGRT